MNVTYISCNKKEKGGGEEEDEARHLNCVQ